MAGSMRQRGKGSWNLRVFVGWDPATRKRDYLERTVRGKSRGFSTTFGALRAARATFAADVFEPPLLDGGYRFAGRCYGDPRAETLAELLTEAAAEVRKERRIRRLEERRDAE